MVKRTTVFDYDNSYSSLFEIHKVIFSKKENEKKIINRREKGTLFRLFFFCKTKENSMAIIQHNSSV